MKKMLHQIESRLDSFSKSEKKLAKVILEDPESIVHMATATLARKAGVSDPSVSRFAKTLECSSFPAFKVKLAQSLTRETSHVSQSIDADDDSAQIIDKLLTANSHALDFVRRHLTLRQVDKAAEMLADAKLINLFGLGASASIAHDMQHKLFRFGTPVIAYEDSIKQRMVAAAADKNTLFIIMSFTGCTETTVDSARIAHEAGAKVIAITAPGSPLSRHADLVLNAGAELEDTTTYVPMTTRTVVLTLADIIITKLALNMGQVFDEQLRHIKDSLRTTKIQ